MTQLYVSVDAATRDELKAIDRPLFKDFWQRFLDCLTTLRDKRQRTVYRCAIFVRHDTRISTKILSVTGGGAVSVAADMQLCRCLIVHHAFPLATHASGTSKASKAAAAAAAWQHCCR